MRRKRGRAAIEMCVECGTADWWLTYDPVQRCCSTCRRTEYWDPVPDRWVLGP